MLKKETINKIMQEYEQKRNKAEYELEKKRKWINDKFPEIETIESDINNLYLKSTKMVLFSKQNNESDIERLKLKINELSLKKDEILSKNNISKDYLELDFECKKCNDSGFINKYNSNNEFLNSEKCSCLKQRIIKELYKESNMNEIIEYQNFDTFDITKFPNKQISENISITQRENIIEIYEDAIDFTNNFGRIKQPGLFFYGTTGTGKTFLCSCIAKAIMDKGYTVVYQTSKKIMQTATETLFKNNYYNYLNKLGDDYNEIVNCDLLIIDDLGTEMITKVTTSEMFNILNERIIANKPTIISTNLSMKHIQKIYSPRVLSRINENFTVYKFYGEDLRMISAR